MFDWFTVLRNAYTDCDHDSRFKVLSNFILSYLVKYIYRFMHTVQSVHGICNSTNRYYKVFAYL